MFPNGKIVNPHEPFDVRCFLNMAGGWYFSVKGHFQIIPPPVREAESIELQRKFRLSHRGSVVVFPVINEEDFAEDWQ